MEIRAIVHDSLSKNFHLYLLHYLLPLDIGHEQAYDYHHQDYYDHGNSCDDAPGQWGHQVLDTRGGTTEAHGGGGEYGRGGCCGGGGGGGGGGE